MSMVEMSLEKRTRLETNLKEFKKQRDFWQNLVDGLEKELAENVEWHSDLEKYEKEINEMIECKTINHIITNPVSIINKRKKK